MLLTPTTDPMGQAIADFHREGKAHDLVVRSSLFDDDLLPVPHLFRSPLQMPLLEQEALRHCRGRVLDVGAGAGAHALVLQAQGHEVTAIDVSPLSVEVMRERGLRDAHCLDFLSDPPTGQYDTILMMMNGIGICGGLNELPRFFACLDAWLAPDGQVLTDSCDLAYLFDDEEEREAIAAEGGYYGEIDYQMSYGEIQGPVFNWLYVDFPTLSAHAEEQGYRAELLCEGEQGAYLARLLRQKLL